MNAPVQALQRAAWRHRFLDAYRCNIGDARRIALDTAWAEYTCSESDSQDEEFSHYDYAYWKALVDAAAVEQERSRETARIWAQGGAGVILPDFGLGAGGGEATFVLGQGAQGVKRLGIMGIGGDQGVRDLWIMGRRTLPNRILDWLKGKLWVRTDADKEDEKV